MVTTYYDNTYVSKNSTCFNFKNFLILMLFFFVSNCKTLTGKDSHIKATNFIEKGKSLETKINSATNGSSNIQIQMNTKLKMRIQTFLTYFKEYSKIHVNYQHLSDIKAKSKMNSPETAVAADHMYGYYNSATNEIEFTENELTDTRLTLAAKGIYDRTRYQIGWDKLNIKTFSEVNPLIQCWVAGFIEGVLNAEEIYFYYKNIQVFFQGQEGLMDDIKNFYAKIDQKLKESITTESFEKLKDSSDENATQHWTYITCLHAQLDGLYNGYNKIADEGKQMTLLDFYLINSEGNFGDLKTFMKINKMKISDLGQFYTNENLKKIYDTDNIEKIWKSIVRGGHCSAVVKLVTTPEGAFDLISGHNTWTEYCEMLRSLKLMEWGFEGQNQVIGMKPRTVSFSSYPGILFSGDDFYELDYKVVVLQTTLSTINKFIYKDIINPDQYIPEFMRLMIINLTSHNGHDWVKNYKSYKNHMYITQWIVLDYNVLAEINEDKLNHNKTFLKKLHKDKYSRLAYLLEEVPGSIMYEDISDMLLQNTYFGSFNLAYFQEHQKILGLKNFSSIDFTSKNYNPRYYILKALHKNVNNLEDFATLMQYNGFKNNNPNFANDPSYQNPESGISARYDLTEFESFNGGVDFKIVNTQLINTMSLYVYGGPTYAQNPHLPPFNFAALADKPEDSFHQGIPKVWNFKPFFFSKKDFEK